VALYFSDLAVVCTHTGWPWTEEAVALAWKHPNLFLGTSAHAPKYWKPELIHFIDSWGQNKVLFGTDFPVIEFRRATAEVKELKLKEASIENLMWKNAARVYDLKPADGFDWRASQSR
jgi:predicted TIM-barrel fold metal-dependent hydrolase